ncbi:MAG: F0F1 ATP synthase subunit B [Longimicrobiales bacterium]
MNLLMILLQEHTAEPVSVFNLTANVSFWTVIIFLVLLTVLLKFAFPPILGYAAAREARIQQTLDDAKTQRAEAESLLAQQREQLAQARAEAQQMIAEGKQAAERVRQDLLEKTRVEQQELLERAKAEIVREREQAVEHVRRAAVELAIAAAAKLVGEKFDADADRRIVSEYLDSVGSQDPAGVA